MKFKNLKEFDKCISSVRKCIKDNGFCIDILDHYYYNDKGKKIRRKTKDHRMIEIVKKTK